MFLLYSILFPHSFILQAVANIGKKLYDGESMETNSFVPADDAVALMHWLELTREDMRRMRYFMKAHGISDFPTTNQLLDARKFFRPTVFPILDGKGVAVDEEELIRETTEAIVQMHAPPGTKSGEIRMVFKEGGDGASGQSVWKSKKTKENAQTMFQYSLLPLRAETVSEPPVVIWRNSAPNSPHSLRSLYLIREKEDDEELLAHVVPETDKCRKKMEENGINIELRDKRVINVAVKLIDSMKDMKFKRKLSGLGGAECLMCETRPDDWSDPKQIENGFPITRSHENTEALYQRICDEDGDVPRKAKDFNDRKGLTCKPLTTSSQRSATVTHGYINGVRWFVKLLSHVRINWNTWKEVCEAKGGAHVKQSKEAILAAVLDKTGMRIEQVQQGGHGGTSTDGNAGRRFFSEEILPIFDVLLPKDNQREKKEQVIELHVMISSILRINSCTSPIDVAKYQKLCKDTSLYLAKNFKWARWNQTLHAIVHHGPELCKDNGDRGLGELSEEPLEANNKDIRKYLNDKSRKSDPVSQLTDCMNRNLERSHPKVRSLILNYKPDKSCTICGQAEHTARTHYKVVGVEIGRYDRHVLDIIG